ncbi:MAG: AAA family ATPase [Oliverpabstia sp.]
MIICIGREFGSGGHEIGERLADKLSIPFYDQELITTVMEKCANMDMKTIQKVDEKKANPWLHKIWYESVDKDLRGLPANDIVFKFQSNVIIDYAKKGDCVFVGRCADYILKQAGIERMSLFITAPFTDRVERKMKQLNKTDKETANLVRKIDKQRKNYYNYHTNGNWGKPDTYDFCINSYGRHSEHTAEVLSKFVSKMR